MSATVLHQLPRVADAEQFERYLAALANGLTTELHQRRLEEVHQGLRRNKPYRCASYRV